jgi:hypothetical protein
LAPLKLQPATDVPQLATVWPSAGEVLAVKLASPE